MKTGFHGTFVISWSQTELDGEWSAPLDVLRVGASWIWTGEAVRVDGPSEILPLGTATGMVEMRKRAAHTVRRLLNAVDKNTPFSESLSDAPPLAEKSFNVTDGRSTWNVTLIEAGQGRKPLLVFVGEIPPRDTEMWIVAHNIDTGRVARANANPGGVICFTPGTMIQTEFGPRLVESLREGDRIQTKDNGCREILWIGQRRMTGARLFAMPHLAPVRMRRGALDEVVPDDGILVSPDHRMVLKGARARALFNCDEVLVAARDLVNDSSVYVDRAVREVTYVHLLLPGHEIVFANGVETESFHPASAALSYLDEHDRMRLMTRIPEAGCDPMAYGAFARRVLSGYETAVLRQDF